MKDASSIPRAVKSMPLFEMRPIAKTDVFLLILHFLIIVLGLQFFIYDWFFDYEWFFDSAFHNLFVTMFMSYIFTFRIGLLKSMATWIVAFVFVVQLLSPDFILLNKVRIFNSHEILSKLDEGEVINWGGDGFLDEGYWYYIMRGNMENIDVIAQIQNGRSKWLNNYECNSNHYQITDDYILIGSRCG